MYAPQLTDLAASILTLLYFYSMYAPNTFCNASPYFHPFPLHSLYPSEYVTCSSIFKPLSKSLFVHQWVCILSSYITTGYLFDIFACLPFSPHLVSTTMWKHQEIAQFLDPRLDIFCWCVVWYVIHTVWYYPWYFIYTLLSFSDCLKGKTD